MNENIDMATQIKVEPDDITIDETPMTIKEEPMDVDTEEPGKEKREEDADRRVIQKKKQKRYCNVSGCMSTSTTHKDYSFITLPKDPYKRSDWLQLIDRKDLIKRTKYNHVYVCEKHFKATDLIVGTNRKTIKKNTFPSLALPEPRLRDAEVVALDLLTHEQAVQASPPLRDRDMQTDQAGAVADASAQVDLETFEDFKAKINTPLITARRQLKLLECPSKKAKKRNFHSACDKFLSPHLSEIIKCHTGLKINSTGNRYTFAQKRFSLNLFNTSEEAYKMIEKDFCLPTEESLRHMDVPVSTNSSKDVLAALKVKVKSMADEEKYCAVIVDIMKIKPSVFYNAKQDRMTGLHEIDGSQKAIAARHALVIVVKGILEDWMQPIGFAFLSDTKTTQDVSLWIDNVLGTLLDIGLKIKAYIPNFTSALIDEARIRNISVEKPYFLINNVKIYFVYNALDLMRQAHNAFLTHDFHYRNSNGRKGVAKIEFIREFYAQDREKKLRLAPNLTDSHVLENGRSTVRFAAQLFSRAVATALSMYIDYAKIDKTAQDTVEVLLLINNLFDLLNSSSISNHQFKTAFTGESTQKMIMNKALGFFQSLGVLNATSDLNPQLSVEFIKGFQVSILAIIYISQELKDEGYENLLTRRLTLDATEKMFKGIRERGNPVALPPCHMFAMAFRRLYFKYMMKPLKVGNACSKEVTGLLVQQTDCADQSDGSRDGATNVTVKNVFVAGSDELRLAATNSVREVCSFLLKKCLDTKLHKRKCDTLKKIKKYKNEPSIKQIEQYILMMENEFQNILEMVHDRDLKLGSGLFAKISDLTFAPPCPCFPTTYLQKLFIRLRLNMTQNYNNKTFKGKKGVGKQFVVPKLTG